MKEMTFTQVPDRVKTGYQFIWWLLCQFLAGKRTHVMFDHDCRDGVEEAKGFSWTGWIKAANQAPKVPHKTYSMAIGDALCVHKEEIKVMVDAYWKKYPANGGAGFLVGSSLVGNKHGDSARFHELKALCAEQCRG